MTQAEVAELIERYALSVEQMPGPSSRNPHAYSDRKLTLVDEMRSHARQLRTMPSRGDVVAFRPGVRIVAGRSVDVEVRRRRA